MNILETTIKARELFSQFELCRMQEEETRRLQERLENKKVTIAVIGQFKRGKTTLINTILGRPILPVGIVPITAAITRIEYADKNGAETNADTATVYYTNGLREEVPAEDLHAYISEQENHDNARGVAEVELLTDAAFLRDGLTLVDTPGVGSVHENNSKSAVDFARESDGVVFMLSVDSPVNQIEVDFLRKVKQFGGKFYCVVKGPEIMERSVGRKLLQILNQTRSQIASYREVLKMAPNVFNRRFDEMRQLMETRRQKLQTLEDRPYLRAQLNEEKALRTGKVRELFGIEYYYFVDREDAAELMDREAYAAELGAVYDELELTINSIFMYKEENAYTVARRIEDLNILMQQMRKLSRQIEKEM